MCTQTHVRTYTHRHTHTHVHAYTDTCTYTCTYVRTYIHRYMYIHTQTHVHTHTHAHTSAHTPCKKLQYFVVHSQIRVLHIGGGREHSTHSLLCFHCAQLLSSLTPPSANDSSSLSSEPAQQDGPGGHTRPHHNFHSPLASRRVEISSPVLE
ncbi:unnamed protein product, partial [Staurois parvus]